MNHKKTREPRYRLNIDVINTPLRTNKMTGKDLIELAKYALDYPPFTYQMTTTDKPILTIKQFSIELCKEMNYHKEIDEIEG